MARVTTVRLKQGRLIGELSASGFELRAQADWLVSAEDVGATSAIEGERLDPASVRSSVGRRLGLDRGGVGLDRRLEGLVDVVLDATRNAQRPLTARRLPLTWGPPSFAYCTSL